MFPPEFAFKKLSSVLKLFCFTLWHILFSLTYKYGCIIAQQGTLVILEEMTIFCLAEIPTGRKLSVQAVTLSRRVQIEN